MRLTLCHCGRVQPCTVHRRRRTGSDRPDLNTAAWQRLRERIKRRDGYRCCRCPATENLSVHHRRQVAIFGPNTAEDELETLCADCHRIADQEAKAVEHSTAVF